MRKRTIRIECVPCQGLGIGQFSPKCGYCKGAGYYVVKTDDPDWIEHCLESDLDPLTGEEND